MQPHPATSSPNAAPDPVPPPAVRDETLDQFRGYAVFGMILVNSLGGFDSVTESFKHHSDYMTYADTIAPLFIFVSGMGAVLSLRRRLRFMLTVAIGSQSSRRGCRARRASQWEGGGPCISPRYRRRVSGAE